MKYIIALMLISLSAFAGIRCNNRLIDIGDNFYEVLDNCPIYETYRVHNNSADEMVVFVKQDGITYELIFIDGILKGIMYANI